jgi:hypothetical protein
MCPTTSSASTATSDERLCVLPQSVQEIRVDRSAESGEIHVADPGDLERLFRSDDVHVSAQGDWRLGEGIVE